MVRKRVVQFPKRIWPTQVHFGYGEGESAQQQRAAWDADLTHTCNLHLHFTFQVSDLESHPTAIRWDEGERLRLREWREFPKSQNWLRGRAGFVGPKSTDQTLYFVLNHRQIETQLDLGIIRIALSFRILMTFLRLCNEWIYISIVSARKCISYLRTWI